LGGEVGYVTRAIRGVCTRGSVVILTTELPWFLDYASFTGTLPNITDVRMGISLMGFKLREPFLGAECLSLSTPGQPVFMDLTLSAGALTRAELSGEISTGGECGTVRNAIGGTSAALTSSSGSRITVTLI
jgi:hypothetical protein